MKTSLNHFQVLWDNQFSSELYKSQVRRLHGIQGGGTVVFQRAVDAQSSWEACLLCTAAWRRQCQDSLECPWWCTRSHLQSIRQEAKTLRQLTVEMKEKKEESYMFWSRFAWVRVVHCNFEKAVWQTHIQRKKKKKIRIIQEKSAKKDDPSQGWSVVNASTESFAFYLDKKF